MWVVEPHVSACGAAITWYLRIHTPPPFKSCDLCADSDKWRIQMINSVGSATHAQTAAQPAAGTKQLAQSKPQLAPTDTVQLSAGAQSLKEAIENPVQTAR